jgi:hypothetical protein
MCFSSQRYALSGFARWIRHVPLSLFTILFHFPIAQLLFLDDSVQ